MSETNVQRELLFSELDRMIRETAAETGITELSPRIRQALREVPRDEFVSSEQQGSAWANHPLSIGSGQTISQPYIVALMTALADPGEDDRVLEIGTGSGYQTAILAELAREVFSVERIDSLAAGARRRLEKMGYRNVELLTGDGYEGWPDHAPYDAILVTAAPDRMPEALTSQLAEGGRLVVPVGSRWQGQHLLVATREDGRLVQRRTIAVRFVPML